MDLHQKIRDGATVEGELVLVDQFLNHRVEPAVMAEVGRRIAKLAAPLLPDVILTAEASGIPPALAASLEAGIPMIYAKKYVQPGPRRGYWREVGSATKGFEYCIEVRRHVLPPCRVLIIDDFLHRGRTAIALGEIVEEAGGEVAGMVFVVEKAFAGGRGPIERRGWPIWPLVSIASLEGGEVSFT